MRSIIAPLPCAALKTDQTGYSAKCLHLCQMSFYPRDINKVRPSMLPDTIPSYLQPISPNQRAQLDVEQQQLGQQAASDASRMLAQSMEQNRRKAATKAMLSDAEIAHTLGEDADTAALTSFKKYAPTWVCQRSR